VTILISGPADALEIRVGSENDLGTILRGWGENP
jgi:hypothetical protein